MTRWLVDAMKSVLGLAILGRVRPSAHFSGVVRSGSGAGSMRSVFFGMYSVMALWMLVAAVLRVLFSLGSGVPVDLLPGVTGVFGLVALAALVPRTIRRIRGRTQPRIGAMIELPHGEEPRAPRS